MNFSLSRQQSAVGKKLDSLQDIARVIQEEIKEKEFNDQN